MTDFKADFFRFHGFTPSWSEYVTKLAEADDGPKGIENTLPTLKMIPYQKPKKHYLSIILP